MAKPALLFLMALLLVPAAGEAAGTMSNGDIAAFEEDLQEHILILDALVRAGLPPRLGSLGETEDLAGKLDELLACTPDPDETPSPDRTAKPGGTPILDRKTKPGAMASPGNAASPDQLMAREALCAAACELASTEAAVRAALAGRKVGRARALFGERFIPACIEVLILLNAARAAGNP